MSQTIAVITIDDDIGDDKNMVGLKNFSALGLNNFEFFPHFDKSNSGVGKRLKEYSKASKSVIYTCNDGDGIIVDDDNIQFFGEVLKIENGKIMKAWEKLHPATKYMMSNKLRIYRNAVQNKFQ